MTSGKRLISNYDEHGYAVFLDRKWSQRDHQSDRKKRVRKMAGKTMRTRLKREFKEELNNF